MTAPDPLAEVLQAAMTRATFNEDDGSTSVYFNDGAHLARAARDFIAAEIRHERDHAGYNTEERAGLTYAASIARGQT